MAVMVPRELRGSPVGRRGDCESGRPRAPGRSSDGAGRPAGWSGRRHCLRECCPGNGVPVAGRALSRTYVTCDHHVSVGLIAAVGADFQPVESGHSAGAPDPPFTDFYEPLFDEVLFVSQARIAFNTSRHAEPPVSMDVVLPVTAARCARRLAGIAAEPRGRATPRQLFRTGALPKDDHGSVDCHALAEAFPTVPARTTARGTAPREAVATTAVQTRTAPGPPRGLRPPASDAALGLPDGDVAAGAPGRAAGAVRRRAAAPAVHLRDAPVDELRADFPRTRRTARQGHLRSSDTPPARPVALRGAGPPPPEAATIPTSLT